MTDYEVITLEQINKRIQRIENMLLYIINKGKPEYKSRGMV